MDFPKRYLAAAQSDLGGPDEGKASLNLNLIDSNNISYLDTAEEWNYTVILCKYCKPVVRFALYVQNGRCSNYACNKIKNGLVS